MSSLPRFAGLLAGLIFLAGIPTFGTIEDTGTGTDSSSFNPVGARSGDYLVIAAPAFTSSTGLQNLMALRISEGFGVVLADTSTTGPTAQEIRSYIQNAYNTWIVPPAFLLLIGDTDTIPCWTGGGTGTPPTDLNYACMDNNFLPDICYGRLPVRTVFELDTLCAKITAMDLNSRTEAAFLAGEADWQRSEAAHDAVINAFLDPAGWTSDKLYTHTYGASTSRIAAAFDAGRSIGCFTGLGSVNAWLDGPAFSKADVLALTNTVYPLVMSFSCLTGDYSTAECFGETWVRSAHGAAAFYGASAYPFSGSTALLEWHIFEGWQVAGHDRIGAMISHAVYRIEASAGINPDDKRALFEMYNLLGDPAMKIIGSAPPAPDIKINGEDGPLSLPSSQTAVLTVSLDPGDQAGVPHDWWIGALRNGSGLYCWIPAGGWAMSSVPVRAYDGPLISLTDRLISQGNIPIGSWEITFAVDTLNNVFEGTWSDTISVTSY